MTYAEAQSRDLRPVPVYAVYAFEGLNALVWCGACSATHKHGRWPGRRRPRCSTAKGRRATRDGYYIAALAALVKTLPREAQAVWRGWTLEDVERVTLHMRN